MARSEDVAVVFTWCALELYMVQVRDTSLCQLISLAALESESPTTCRHRYLFLPSFGWVLQVIHLHAVKIYLP